MGFTHRDLDADEAGDLANYAVAIRRNGEGEARVYFYGALAPDSPVLAVTPADLLELRLEWTPTIRRLHLERYTLPSMVQTPSPPLICPRASRASMRGTSPCLAVTLAAANSGVHNLRYRRVYDPDSDNDWMADRWERRSSKPFRSFPQLNRSSRTGFRLRRAGQPGRVQTGPHRTFKDSDGDLMWDGWEVDHGLNPRIDDAWNDPDGDGIMNRPSFSTTSLTTNPATTAPIPERQIQTMPKPMTMESPSWGNARLRGGIRRLQSRAATASTGTGTTFLIDGKWKMAST